MVDLQQPDYERRFSGVRRLYGEQGLARLQAAHICVIGIGGVGSVDADAVCMVGVGVGVEEDGGVVFVGCGGQGLAVEVDCFGEWCAGAESVDGASTVVGGDGAQGSVGEGVVAVAPGDGVRAAGDRKSVV